MRKPPLKSVVLTAGALVLFGLALYQGGVAYREARSPDFPPVSLKGPHQLTIGSALPGERAQSVVLQLSAIHESGMTAQLLCQQGDGGIRLRVAPDSSEAPASKALSPGPVMLEANGLYVLFNALQEPGVEGLVLYAHDVGALIESMGDSQGLTLHTLEGSPLIQMTFGTALKEALLAARQQCAPAGSPIPGFFAK